MFIRSPILARIALAIYAVMIIAITFIHNAYHLLFIVPLLFLVSGRQALHIFKHTIKSILFFNIIITLSFASLSLYRGTPFIDSIALMNLRVFLLTYLTFLFIHRIHLPAALSFSSTLSFLVTLSWSQAILYRKLYKEFLLAHKSRSPIPPALKDRWHLVGVSGKYLLEKSLHDSMEKGLAMRSRGFFNDADESDEVCSDQF